MSDTAVQPLTTGNLNAVISSRIEFITKHFAVISSVVTLTSATATMLCLAGYLAAFNSSLIWIVQSTDLIQFVLIAIPTLAAAAYFIELVFAAAVHLVFGERESKYRRFLIAMVTLNFAIDLIGDETSTNPHWYYHFLQVCCFLSILQWLRLFHAWRTDPATFTAANVAQNITAFVVAIGTFGGTFGHYVKDISDKRYDVSTKTGEIKGVKLVISLSRATVILDQDRVIVVPEADLNRITESQDRLKTPE